MDIAIALPQPRLHFERIRGLYNGFGYVLALCMMQNLWWTSQETLPQLLAGHTRQFAQNFAHSAWWTWVAMIPGPALIPVFVNLAPRSGMRRVLWLLSVALVMQWWCLSLVEQVHFGWDWPSLGFALDGILTTSLVVFVCAYHADTREAADAMMGARIERTRLDSELMQSQLQLLRAQIEPHFMFNTLSVIRALSRNDREATVAMLDHLIRYFQAALPRLRDSEVPLAQELELIDAYLAIYQARMGTRLGYEITLPQTLREAKIPSMILLTLVENALKHGVAPAVEGGLIHVCASREQNSLVLKVADSGRGLDVRHGRGTGLANIRQRLLMMYGSEAMLTLRPAEPRGVVASISLPCTEQA